MLEAIRIAGYRSVRNLLHGFGGIDVFVGPNGCGKSNLYRGLRLLAAAAEGRLAAALAQEGGMASALSASEPAPATAIVLGCRVDGWDYELEIGTPPTGQRTAFRLDPHVRRERLRFLAGERPVEFLRRDHMRTVVCDENGRQRDLLAALPHGETALGSLRDPVQFPELAALRETLSGWRFYHQFRTDEGSPLRRPTIGTWTPALAHDGHDLAAALQSILEAGPAAGDGTGIEPWFERAFPGSSFSVSVRGATFGLLVDMPGISRPLTAADVSDGTLRFLCLLAALRSVRPPQLLVLNEPENSLHPSVLPTLAELVVAAGQLSQIVLTTHSNLLADAIARATERPATALELRNGETRVVGRGRYE